MKRFFFIAAGIAVATTPAFAVNILSNPGFETGTLNPWFQLQDFGGAENWNVSNADAHSGSFSATDVGNKEIFQSITPTATSAITEVSFWIKNLDSGAHVNAIDFNYSDSSVGEFIFFESTSDWEHFDMTSNLAAGKTLVGVGIWGFSGGGADEDRTRLDDAVVNVVPEPMTLVALGIGAAGLIKRRRK